MYKLKLAPADRQKCSLRREGNNEIFKRKIFGDWVIWSYKVMNLDMIRWIGSLSDVFVKSGLSEPFVEVVCECEVDVQTSVCRYENIEEFCKSFADLKENKLVEKVTLGFGYDELALFVEYDLIDDSTRIRVPLKYKASNLNGMINKAITLYNESGIKIFDVLK